MKRILLVTAILMANVLTMSAAKKQVIDRIEPTDWYVGMKNPQVQWQPIIRAWSSTVWFASIRLTTCSFT